MPSLTFFLLSLLGGVLSLDRTAFFQSMISRPIVAGPLAGLILGDFETGCWCAIFLELLWLMRLPIGGAVPPDDALATLAAVAAASSLVSHGVTSHLDASTMGVLFGLPFAYFGRWADLKIRNQNGVTYLRVRKALAEGKPVRLFRPHFDCAARFFLAGATMALAATFTGWFLGGLTGNLFARLFSIADGRILALAILTAGAGSLLAGLGAKYSRAIYAVSAALGFFCSAYLMAAP